MYDALTYGFKLDKDLMPKWSKLIYLNLYSITSCNLNELRTSKNWNVSLHQILATFTERRTRCNKMKNSARSTHSPNESDGKKALHTHTRTHDLLTTRRKRLGFLNLWQIIQLSLMVCTCMRKKRAKRSQRQLAGYALQSMYI